MAWLLINQSLAVGDIVLGSVLALVGAWTVALLDPPEVRLRRPGIALQLLGAVLVDNIRSNRAVAWIILRAGPQRHTPGFVRIPLHLRDPYGLAVLACIITSTPGTLWVSFESATGILTIHVLDLVDEAMWVQTIKNRYERPLLEIFG
jgi:multicomponent K+:H+ antiporter subunit E